MRQFITLALVLFSFSLFAQTNSFQIERTLAWADQPVTMYSPDGAPLSILSFKGCSRAVEAPTLPLYNERFGLEGPATLSVRIVDAQWEPVARIADPFEAAIGAGVTPKTAVEQERLQFFGRVTFIPLRRNGDNWERLRSFTLQVEVSPLPATPLQPSGGVSERTVTNSKLADGDIYKFGVTQTAVYKLTYDFLKNKLGITNLDQIDPRNIQVLGNGGAMLPEPNGTPRPDDLLENAVFVSGEQDGKFDSGDFILFYAVGPSVLTPSITASNAKLTIKNNLYDNAAWYFVKIAGTQGLRITERPSENGVAATAEFDDVSRYEDERYNLLNWSAVHQGSGKRWFGDLFEQTRVREYSMSFPNIIAQPSDVRMEFAGRCASSSTVRLTAAGTVFSGAVGSSIVSSNTAPIASNASIGGAFTPSGDNISLKVEYLNTATVSQGWLDYIEINVRRKLIMSNKMMSFRDLRTRLNVSTNFQLSGVSSGLNIWDVTTFYTPQRQAYTLNGSVAGFGANTDGVVREFIAFYDNADFPLPERIAGKIANQNLHALDQEDMLLLYAPELEAPALRLAEHRRSHSGLKVAAIPVQLVFNEFSSGKKDPVAIRDFSRMLFERNPTGFRYLLLFGDGTYDPKNNRKDSNHSDPVPVWETDNSFSPIEAHPSDDFFGLLSPNEPAPELVGSLDIAVGRIPAVDVTDGEAVTDKIIQYDTDPSTLGDWHNRLIYVADDEESNHIDQAEVLSNRSLATENWFNSSKVYFDAYQRVSSSSEKRIPDAKAAINADMFKGALTMNYIGHGGPKGWGQERVVDIADIQGWENKSRLPLFITATCSFGGFDDHNFVSGGELVLTQPNGGGIALFTTVRPVFISSNDALTNSVQQFIFEKDNTQQYRTIGEILRVAKNTLTGSVQDNARRFLLFGDPAQHLAMPEYRISTDSINGHAVVAGVPDTLRALQRGSISGSVTGPDGVLDDFNGRVFVTIFDKEQRLRTLAENNSPLRTYSVRRNVLFRGSATVRNGKFRVSFVVPKDISYNFGYAKISYYAENGTPLDAAFGDTTHLVIGGTSQDVKDDQPPLVQVYMNTDAFVNGGVTDDDPKILIKCSDDNGMNVSGTSIGHDLVAVLDDNVTASIVLNEFYESALDDPRTGKALYPLRNLAAGKHTLRVKGWDIANNPGEGYTEFVVAGDGKAALEHVLNYPNPFTTNTAFQFEHNLAGQAMDVQISIFSVSGKLVKTLQHSTAPEGFRVTDIAWDGRDEYGDQLAKGVYVYRVKVRGTDLNGQEVTAESDFEKLVILK